MGRVTVKANYRGIGEMLRSDFMAAAMLERAEKVMGKAEADAPVDTHRQARHPGRYKAAFKVELDKRGGVHKDRAVARVVNDAPEAFFVEFGNKNVREYAILRAALSEAKD